MRTSASPSSAAPPLNSTPPRAAADKADRIAAGTEITTAQGLAATSSVAARYKRVARVVADEPRKPNQDRIEPTSTATV